MKQIKDLVVPSIVREYRSEHKIEITKIVTSIESEKTPIEMIRGQIIEEIEGMRKLRKQLKEQNPELLVYAK